MTYCKVQHAIDQWLDLGDELHREHPDKYAYFCNDGWAARVLREHRDSLARPGFPGDAMTEHERCEGAMAEAVEELTQQGHRHDSDGMDIYRAAFQVGWYKCRSATMGDKSYARPDPAAVEALVEAAKDLMDVQNGPPLVRDTDEWNATMDACRSALAPFQDKDATRTEA